MGERKNVLLTDIIGILIAEGVGALSGWLTRDDAKTYSTDIVQPPLSPPATVFPIVWGILFALMGISAARVWRAPPSKARTKGLSLFGLQLAFNFFWSVLFFNLRAFGFALLCCWSCGRSFYGCSSPSARWTGSPPGSRSPTFSG